MGLDMYVKKVKKPDLIQEKLFKVRTQELDKDGYVLFDLDDENEAALCKEIMPYAVEADLTASFFDEDKLRKDLTIPDNMHLVITQGGVGARNISLTYAEEKTWRFPISYEDAKEIYKICAGKLGLGLSMLIDILNPEMIVIGSVFTRSENLIREEMERVIEKESLSYTRKACKIVPAALTENIGDYAALSVAAML